MKQRPKITVVIAEDEPVAREKLARWVAAEDDLELLGQAGDGPTAVALLNGTSPPPDLLFLDVKMPGLDGLEVLAQTRPRFVVFTTAFDEFAVAAFDADAVDYLLKPFGPSRFQQTMTRIRRRCQHEGTAPGPERPTTLYAVDQGRVRRVPLTEVARFEARGDYVAAWTESSRFLLATRLRILADQLATAGWVLAHRSHLVRLDKISELITLGSGRYRIVMEDGVEIDTSRAGGRRLREAISRSRLPLE